MCILITFHISITIMKNYIEAPKKLNRITLWPRNFTSRCLLKGHKICMSKRNLHCSVYDSAILRLQDMETTPVSISDG